MDSLIPLSKGNLRIKPIADLEAGGQGAFFDLDLMDKGSVHLRACRDCCFIWNMSKRCEIHRIGL